MNTRISLTRILVLAAAIAGLTVGPVQARTHVDLLSLLRQTGLKYSPVHNDNEAWKLPFDGPHGKTIKVYLTYSNNQRQFALIFATVVHRQPYYAYSRALLVEAMKLNNDKVGIKYVLDEKNGDIDCQREVYLPTATPASLKRALNNVAYGVTLGEKRFGGL